MTYFITVKYKLKAKVKWIKIQLFQTSAQYTDKSQTSQVHEITFKSFRQNNLRHNTIDKIKISLISLNKDKIAINYWWVNLKIHFNKTESYFKFLELITQKIISGNNLLDIITRKLIRILSKKNPYIMKATFILILIQITRMKTKIVKDKNGKLQK
jgi:hypothetical protein